MTNFPTKRTLYADYKVKPMYPPIRVNKKINVAYWDELEYEVQKAFTAVAKFGGIAIEDLKDYVDIKELTEEMIKRIEKQFPEAEFPYVDQDY